jgi:large subunit ribosomal protein L13e
LKLIYFLPSPTHLLRPAVRGQTNRYNGKIKLGRGFTVRELKSAGISGLEYARSIGIAVDLRRKDTSNEALKLNSGRLKEYLSKLILYPRRTNKPAKKPQHAEAKADVLAGPDAKYQNTHSQVIRKQIN